MLRVLIVEDEALIGLLLSDTIEALGYSVCAISSTESDAILQATRLEPDLMIVDAGLRVGSGISAVEAITRIRAIPYIFVTGNKRSVRLRCREAIILEKPYFMPDLVLAIERALALSVGP